MLSVPPEGGALLFLKPLSVLEFEYPTPKNGRMILSDKNEAELIKILLQRIIYRSPSFLSKGSSNHSSALDSRILEPITAQETTELRLQGAQRALKVNLQTAQFPSMYAGGVICF